MTTRNASHQPLDTGGAAVPAISVVIVTYNRADLLADAIEHVLAQDDPATPAFELIVVDNNSSDATPAVVERASLRDPRVRYVRQPQQGVSHARNAGIAAARAPIIAYTDDDVRVSRGWLASIARAFREYPGVSAVGGKVLPLWPAEPPAWLTPAHWGPLALADHGDHPVRVDAANEICLIGCNLAVVRGAFDQVGGFSAHVQRTEHTIGSSEDHEFLLRLFAAGAFGMYDPRIVLHAAVQPERLDRAYHRRWHRSQGHYNAMMRPDYLERSNVGRLFDVPAHLYRAAARDAFTWIGATLRRDDAEAFARELRLQFFLGFLRTRRRQFQSLPPAERRTHWRGLARALIGQRPEPPTPAATVGERS
jgi:glycosyltransferase involved in cell wall biosynthesis